MIRPLSAHDAKNILELYKHYIESTTITFEEEIPSLEDFTNRIRSISERYPYIVAEDKGRLIGFAYATQFRERSAYRWLVEVAIYVDVNQQGKGAGKHLLDTLLDILARLGYYDAYAVVTLPNKRSIELFESFGFEKSTVLKQAGYKHNRWCDAGIWVKNLRPRNDTPGEPELFSDYKNNFTALVF